MFLDILIQISKRIKLYNDKKDALKYVLKSCFFKVIDRLGK